MSWGDVGGFFASDAAPWWAAIGAPVLTYWIGQKTTSRATERERDAATAEADAERMAETERQQAERSHQATMQLTASRTVAFADALDAIARLQAEIAKSSIEQYGPRDEDGSAPRIVLPEHAVDPDALREFVGSVSKLRIYSNDQILDIDILVDDVSSYVMLWPEPGYRPDHEPLMRDLNELAREIGAEYARLTRAAAN